MPGQTAIETYRVALVSKLVAEYRNELWILLPETSRSLKPRASCYRGIRIYRWTNLL